MKKGCLLALALLVLPLFFANHSTIQAASKGLEPTADSYVDEYYPDTNYGGDSILELEDNPWGDETLIFLKFDLSELPSDAKIDEVTLRLNTYHVGATKNIGVHSVSSTTWDELTITYNNKPSHATTVTDNVTVGYDDTWYEWNVTSDVPEEITTQNIFSWALEIETLIGDYEDVWFYSKESGWWGEEPELSVSYSSSEERLFYAVIALVVIGAIAGIAIFLVKRKKVKPPIQPKGPEMLKETVFCPYCGVKNAVTSKFCTNCGRDITAS